MPQRELSIGRVTVITRYKRRCKKQKIKLGLVMRASRLGILSAGRTIFIPPGFTASVVECTLE
jgi:hypothetical protein